LVQARCKVSFIEENFSHAATVRKMKPHPAIKPAVCGAIVGAVVMVIVGFWALGWTVGSTAERMANERAESATVAALTPVCVARFEAQADAATKLAALKKAASWDQSSYIEKEVGPHRRAAPLRIGQ
jgi:hypothetical protein